MALLTQKVILKTFQDMLEEMPFDKISVSALVKRAGISSSTFYYHYEDIYALLNTWLRTLMNSFTDLESPDFDWKEGTKLLLRSCRAHSSILYHVFDSLSRDQLERYIFSLTDGVFFRQVKRQAVDSGISDEKLREICSFCRYAYIGFLMQFAWEGMKMDIDLNVDRLAVLLHNFVRCSIALSDGE